MRGGPDTFLISCGVGDECWVMITGAVVDVVIVTLACAFFHGHGFLHTRILCIA